MRYKSKKKLSRNLKINASEDTVRRALQNNCLGALPNIVEKLDIRNDNDNKKEPLFWCKDNIIWTLDNWKRVIITGELRVYHFSSDG
jgi:hypothetical protein